MSLGTFLLGAAVTFIITSRCSGGICDQGPPGKFCLSDFSGYHDCIVNKQTSKSHDVIKRCPAGTRCTCMGIPCRTSNPCGKYELPPIMPDSYHTEYNEQSTTCGPVGQCHTTYSRFAFWRDAQHLRYREDRTIGPSHDPPYEYFIISLYSRRWLLKHHIIPSKQSCTKHLVWRLPSKIQVPTKYNYYGRKYVYGEYCKRWVWMEGGRYGSQPVNVETWDTAHTINGTPTVVQYSAYFPGSQMSKTSLKIERYYYLFEPGVPSDERFQLPTYCH